MQIRTEKIMLNTDKLCMGCMNYNGGEKICPTCGYDSNTANPENLLPTRFVLHNRYIVGKALNANGEGVTYLGWDNINDTAVHIREYFPIGVAIRINDGTIDIIDEQKYTFNEGLMEFLEIGKQLMNSELPSIIPVNAIFEENGTAYSVSPIIQSITLEDFLVRNGGSLKWEQARPLFLPLIDTISGLHSQGILHGGISPETIIVGRDGKLRLSNISIHLLHESDSGFVAQLFDGYSAAEQYGVHKLNTGDYTDVYSLSAVLFRVLIGTVPPTAISRIEKDSLSIPAHFAEELPRQVLVSLANAMQPLPSKRTANIELFKNELVYGETAENKPAPVKANSPAPTPTKAAKKKGMNPSAKYAIISASVTAAVFIAISGIVVWLFRDQIFNPQEAPLNTSSDYVTESDRPHIGDYDSAVVDSVKLYDVPQLVGKYYSQLDGVEEYEKFKIVIADKSYSDKYQRGAICEQSIQAGTGVAKDTTIKVTISLGPQEFKVANVIGLTEQEAKIELLKQGFLYENIVVDEAYDSSAKPGVVLEQTPEFNSKTNAEAVVHIFINTYTEKDNSSSSSNSNNSSNSNSSGRNNGSSFFDKIFH